LARHGVKLVMMRYEGKITDEDFERLWAEAVQGERSSTKGPG
jgi:hypothetical protein